MLRFSLADPCGYVRSEHLGKATGSHFNLPGHSSADTTITVIQQSKKNNSRYRKEREQFYINLKGGLNDLNTLQEWVNDVKSRWNPAFQPNLIKFIHPEKGFIQFINLKNVSLIHVREKKPIALIHVREQKPIAVIHVREKKHIALIHVREKGILLDVHIKTVWR